MGEWLGRYGGGVCTWDLGAEVFNCVGVCVVSDVWYSALLYNVSEALRYFRGDGCVSFVCNKSYVGHDGVFVMI